MAQNAQKKTVKFKSKPAKSNRTKRPAATPRRHKGQSKFAAFFLPAVLCAIILGAIGFLGFRGYQTVTASEFFNVQVVEVSDTKRTSGDEIRRLVKNQTERSGVWNADLAEIRQKIEKLSFVRAASITRVLPNGFTVQVSEREPLAIAKIGENNFLVDGEGVILGPADKPEPSMPIVMKGWDSERSPRAETENIQRVALYQKMLAEWRQFELAKRVKEVDLANLRDPRVVIEDSGTPIAVSLSKDEIGKSLKTALEAVAGKGAIVKSVDVGGTYPVIQYMGSR
ncbi:MAG: FtsQ-type POTRA domain-containing protein [Pyrinomonadaceae bacterium]